jgi:hypothetical protein
MDPAEGTQGGPKGRAGPCTGVAVHLAAAIAIIIPRPLVHAVANGGMGWMVAPIALPVVGIQPRADGWDRLREQGSAGACIGMVAAPQALLARVPRHHTDDGRAIVSVGAMPFSLVGTSPGWIRGSRLGRALFPPRCGTARRPRRLCPSSRRSVRSRSEGPEDAAVAYGAVCVSAPTRAPGGPSVLPWPSRVAVVPAWPGVAECFRRRSPSPGCHSPHRRDSDRPERGLAPGIAGAPYSDNAGMACHRGGDAVRAKACRCCHPVPRQSASQSWGNHPTSSTVATHEPLMLTPRQWHRAAK